MELDLQLFGGRGGSSGVATAGGPSMQDTYGQMAEAKTEVGSAPASSPTPKQLPQRWENDIRKVGPPRAKMLGREENREVYHYRQLTGNLSVIHVDDEQEMASLDGALVGAVNAGVSKFFPDRYLKALDGNAERHLRGIRVEPASYNPDTNTLTLNIWREKKNGTPDASSMHTYTGHPDHLYNTEYTRGFNRDDDGGGITYFGGLD